MKSDVKVSDKCPPAKSKGHRGIKPGAERSNAVYPGFPKTEAPWPMAKPKKL